MKTLDEIKKMNPNAKVVTGQKVSKQQVTEAIKNLRTSGTYMDKFEVQAKYFPMLSVMRTKKILDSKCNGVTLGRYYDGKKFWYGAPINK